MLFLWRKSILGTDAESAEATTIAVSGGVSVTAVQSSVPRKWSLRSDQTIPLMMTCGLGLVFMFGELWFPANFGVAIAAAICLATLLTVGGLIRESSLLGFVTASIVFVVTLTWVQQDPYSWFTLDQPYAANIGGAALGPVSYTHLTLPTTPYV